MSGSNSSNPDAAPNAEAIQLTVHDLPSAPRVQVAAQRRTSLGRLKMLMVLAVCASPVIASYLAYFVIKPEGRTNYGSLISPSRALPDLQLLDIDGAPVHTRSLKGQWLLVAVGPAACGSDCEKRLFAQRQLREMLGRERDRLDKVWLLTDAGEPSQALRAAVRAAPAVSVLRWPEVEVAKWLSPEPGRALSDHLYLVDPMGEWMMRFPVDFEPARVKRDIDRLMRASAFWDRAGR